MRFLVDENLPRRLAQWLREQGHDAWHVEDLGLVGVDDLILIASALPEKLTIVSKDDDFVGSASSEVKVLHLMIGNASTAALIAWLAPRLAGAVKALEEDQVCINLK